MSLDPGGCVLECVCVCAGIVCVLFSTFSPQRVAGVFSRGAISMLGKAP